MTSSYINPEGVMAELERSRRDGTLMRIVVQSYAAVVERKSNSPR